MTVLAFTHEPVDIAVAAVVCVAMIAWIWWDHRPHRDKAKPRHIRQPAMQGKQRGAYR